MEDAQLKDIFRDALTLARQAALEAATFIQSHAGGISESEIVTKGLNDLASFVDEGAQDIIVRMISDKFPDHIILAEEGYEEGKSEGGSSLRNQSGFLWIIDPLDGTTNFMHGIPHYGVSIALLYNGEAQVGLIRDVCRAESFFAIRGQGAFLDDQSFRVSPEPLLANSLITTGFPYKHFDFIDAYTTSIRSFWKDSRGVRRPGSASLDLAWVACGRFEGFFEQGLMPWDVAAGALIVEEAGGRYSDFSNGSAAELGSEIVASNGLIHREMIDRLVPLRTPDTK